jgi:hypothetical protein
MSDLIKKNRIIKYNSNSRTLYKNLKEAKSGMVYFKRSTIERIQELKQMGYDLEVFDKEKHENERDKQMSKWRKRS